MKKNPPFESPLQVPPATSATHSSFALPPGRCSVSPDQPIALNLIEIEPGMDALKGVAMELDDCAFPLLTEIVQTSDMSVGFKDVDWALLVGSVPRKAGHGARGSARDQRQDFYRTGQGDQRQRQAQRARAGRRQPLQHQLPDRDAERAGYSRTSSFSP